MNCVDPWGLEDVMVSYIAEKNNGSAVYSEDNFFGLGSWNQKVTVSINGIEKTYSIGKKDSVVRIINDKSVMDNKILMHDFGLDESSSTHQSGDEFDSEEHAAMAWSMSYVPESANAKEEFISLICKNKNGNYTFTTPQTSTSQGVLNNKTKVPEYDDSMGVQAIIHSHPFYVKGAEKDQGFSDDDKNVAKHHMKSMYVGNAMGQVLLYNPHKYIFKIMVITSQLTQYPIILN